MRLLDLCCGAGGAAMGYYRAGFTEIVGVDLDRQRNYPFTFVQGDALTYPLEDFDAIHASPPCQAYTSARTIRGREHPRLIEPVRARLEAAGVPWVIENVMGAPLRPDAMLCGSMFGLETMRHRLFESNVPLSPPPPCNHVWPRGRPVGVYGHTGGKSTGLTSGNHGWLVADWRAAMGIDWMARNELAQAIPPAYTEWIGKQLLQRMTT